MAHPDDNSLEVQVDQALAEYMQQCDAGLAPDREAFLTSHPQLRERLSELLAVADWIEELAGPTLAETTAVSGVCELEQAEATTNERPRPNGGALSIPTYAPAEPFDPGFAETLPIDQGIRSQTLNSHHHTLALEETGEAKNSLLEKPSGVGLSQPSLPCRFGEYVLERVLGQGGMGVVYFGRQVQLERPVAVKMIRSGALASQEEVTRFYAEARSAAKLDHPNIVTVYQCGEYDGHRYFSMDYVPGTDLSKMIQHGPLDCKRAARYVRDVARAIQYAHEQGILHRDLKPANVLVDEKDEVRITDFGLAKSIGTESELTATGAALGTPSYMSPEQAAGRVDEHHHATDIYSLGAVLFTLVTGQPPFKAASTLQTILQVIHRPAPRVRTIRKDINEDLETIVDVCLQKAPERRYRSAAALSEDLNRYLQGSPIDARPASNVRRVWYWLLGIPIVGAIFDNRVVEPTETHRWVQRGLISMALLLVLIWLSILIPSSVWYRNRMPSKVRIAAGPLGGSYDSLARAISSMLIDSIGCEAEVIMSDGSSDNLEKLENSRVELALLQADVLDSINVAVVAPLYYEAVHVLISRGAEIDRLEQLSGRRILVGAEKSGARSVASILLARVGLGLDDIQLDSSDWRSLKSLSSPADAAIVVARPGEFELVELLQGGAFRLLPIANSLQFAMDEPVFHAQILEQTIYPECGLPEGGVPTLYITAFLAARRDTPDVLVHSVLQHLFAPDMVIANGLLTAERAAHWPGLAWHPAARQFFQTYRGMVP